MMPSLNLPPPPSCRQAISETTSLTHNLSHPPTPQSQLYILSDDDHDDQGDVGDDHDHDHGDGGVGGRVDYNDGNDVIIPSPPSCCC